MRGKKYFWTLVVVYLAYLCHGVQAIVASQNLSALAVQWGTDAAGVYNAISYTGLAKFVTVWICGEISDRIGRRKCAVTGAALYVIFFLGCMTTTNYAVACACMFLAGAATSLFDGCLYAAAQESWPKSSGSAVILIKGFISVSGLLYPMLVVSLRNMGAWKVGLIVPAIASAVLLMLALVVPFSYDEELKARKAAGLSAKENANTLDTDARAAAKRFLTPAPKGLVVPLAMMGFVLMAAMYSAQQLLNRYGSVVIGMSDMKSATLTTLFTTGSLLAVLTWSFMMAKRRWRTLKILVIDLVGTIISYALVIGTTNENVLMLGAFTIGFFAAGGALQCGVSLIQEFHPGPKGRNLGIYYTFMGLNSYAMPKLQSMMTASSGEATACRTNLFLNMGIAGLGLVFCLYLCWKYKTWFGVSAMQAKTPDEIY